MQGSILQLGRQDIYFDIDNLKQMSKMFGVELMSSKINYVRNPHLTNPVIDDYTLFASLGFSSVDSMDCFDNEQPSIIHDLNHQIPPDLNLRFDVIYDGGTLEHVFDIASAFRNIHSMVKPGGVVIHASPTNNLVDHGFWQLCPTAFVDTYSANNYTIIRCIISIIEDISNINNVTPTRYKYDQAIFHSLSMGKFPAGIGSTFFAARKPEHHMPFVTPVQYPYKGLRSR